MPATWSGKPGSTSWGTATLTEMLRRSSASPARPRAAFQTAACRQLSSRAQSPEGDDQAAFLGQGDELIGVGETERRVAPAHQSLHADHQPGPEIDERLVMELEFLSFEGPPEVVGRAQPAPGEPVVGLGVDLDARRSDLLGPVHGDVGTAQQGGAGLVAGGRQGDAGAERDGRLTAAGHGQWRAHGREQPFGDLERVGFVDDLVAQNREFVAAEPGQCVARP